MQYFIYDGEGWLVGKEVNGTLVEGFLYDGQLEPVAELDSSGNVVEQFVYGTRPNVTDYIIKGGVEYRVITDQLSSPRFSSRLELCSRISAAPDQSSIKRLRLPDCRTGCTANGTETLSSQVTD
ncbi:MAG: hypothetical protein ACRER7_00155 [Gammaproteobacteria bacterium]